MGLKVYLNFRNLSSRATSLLRSAITMADRDHRNSSLSPSRLHLSANNPKQNSASMNAWCSSSMDIPCPLIRNIPYFVADLIISLMEFLSLLLSKRYSTSAMTDLLTYSGSLRSGRCFIFSRSVLKAGSERLPLAVVSIGEGGGAGEDVEDRRFLIRARAMAESLLWKMCDRMELKENKM